MAHTLLLADDSVTIQRVIELTFADEDIHVVAVSDGNQAIDVLNRSSPDIVLADIGMPGKNGYEVAQYVKTTPRLAHIPVLLLTGAFEPVDQVRATAVGCDGVLTKPFEPQLVIGRVRELLDAPAQQPASGAAALPPPAPRPPAPDGPTVTRPSPTPPEELDHYFERLDEAFANLTNVSPVDSPEPTSSVPADVSRFANKPDVEPQPSSQSATVADLPEDDVSAGSAAPSLADAFAALLSAEQGVPLRPRPPVRIVSAPAPAAVVSEEVIEAIARRVIERLSDAVVRETVREIALEKTERLVREEIERIKSAIK